MAASSESAESCDRLRGRGMAEKLSLESARPRTGTEEKLSLESERPPRLKRLRWLNARLRGLSRRAGLSSQAKSYMPTTLGEAKGLVQLPCGVGVEPLSCGGECAWTSMALAAWRRGDSCSSGQVTRAAGPGWASGVGEGFLALVAIGRVSAAC